MGRNEPLPAERPRVNGDADVADREFMSTLAKGLKVLASFGEQRPTLTLSEAAALVGLSRAAARRVLRTLTSLGYVVQHGRKFALAPRVLELGFGFLATQSWIDLVEPLMKTLSQAVDESCSAAILQGCDRTGSFRQHSQSVPVSLHSTPRLAACNSAFSTKQNCGAACGRSG
jgi:IclR family pca regulon transcriptional regulator